MATKRKILSKTIIKKTEGFQKPKTGQEETQEKEETQKSVSELRNTGHLRPKKFCQFCKTKTEPHYFDMMTLKRFQNDRSRIVSRARSSACSKHQRRITKEIKRARHLSLLPFTVKV